MSTRSRADAFAAALEGGAAEGGALEGGAAGEQQALVEALTLARRELAPLTTPDAEFRDRLRTRLLAVAAVQQQDTAPPDADPAPSPAGGRRWLRPLAAGLASVVVVAGAVVGVDAASRNALPGDLLYGAKRAHERIDLRFTDGRLNQGVARLHLAEHRLDEVRELADRDGGTAYGGVTGTDGDVLAAGSDASRIRATLRDMDQLTRTGSGIVEGVVAKTGDRSPLTLLQTWSTMQADDLRQLEPVLPAAAQDQLASSLTLVADLRSRTTSALGGG